MLAIQMASLRADWQSQHAFLHRLRCIQLQELFGFDSVRFLTDAGSMQTVESERKSKTGFQLGQSEHFQLFIII